VSMVGRRWRGTPRVVVVVVAVKKCCRAKGKLLACTNRQKVKYSRSIPKRKSIQSPPGQIFPTILVPFSIHTMPYRDESSSLHSLFSTTLSSCSLWVQGKDSVPPSLSPSALFPRQWTYIMILLLDNMKRVTALKDLSISPALGKINFLYSPFLSSLQKGPTMNEPLSLSKGFPPSRCQSRSNLEVDIHLLSLWAQLLLSGISVKDQEAGQCHPYSHPLVLCRLHDQHR
jgi:hypothetical protein